MKALYIFKLLIVVMLAKNTYQWALFNDALRIVSAPAKIVISTVKNVVENVVKVFDPHMRGRIFIDGNDCGECRMKPFQSDHGLELYDCQNSNHPSFEPFKTHGSIHIPHVQEYNISSDINVLKLEGKIRINYYRDNNGQLFEFRIDYSIFDQGAFDKLKSSFESKVLSVKPTFSSAKSNSQILCSNLNERVGRINSFNSSKKKVEQTIAETNARIRQLTQQIEDLNSAIDQKSNELTEALRAKELARINLQNKSNDKSALIRNIQNLNMQKVRLVKVNSNELNTSSEHTILSIKERSRCKFLKYQDALETLVPFETANTQCTMRETIENLDFAKTKKCADDIVS